LQELDGETITAEIRFKYMDMYVVFSLNFLKKNGRFPNNLEDYAQNMNKFYEEKKKEELSENFDHDFVPVNENMDIDVLNNEFIKVKFFEKDNISLNI